MCENLSHMNILTHSHTLLTAPIMSWASGICISILEQETLVCTADMPDPSLALHACHCPHLCLSCPNLFLPFLALLILDILSLHLILFHPKYYNFRPITPELYQVIDRSLSFMWLSFPFLFCFSHAAQWFCQSWVTSVCYCCILGALN